MGWIPVPLRVLLLLLPGVNELGSRSVVPIPSQSQSHGVTSGHSARGRIGARAGRGRGRGRRTHARLPQPGPKAQAAGFVRHKASNNIKPLGGLHRNILLLPGRLPLPPRGANSTSRSLRRPHAASASALLPSARFIAQQRPRPRTPHTHVAARSSPPSCLPAGPLASSTLLPIG